MQRKTSSAFSASTASAKLLIPGSRASHIELSDRPPMSHQSYEPNFQYHEPSSQQMAMHGRMTSVGSEPPDECTRNETQTDA